MVRAWPKRFAGLGGLPMQDVKAAIGELERCMGKLGFKGVEINDHINGKTLEEPEFRPFWKAAEETGALVFFHQGGETLVSPRSKKYHLPNSIGNLVDRAVTFATLVHGGVMDQFPKLRIVLGHGGGYTCYGISRMDRGWQVRAEAREKLPKPPSAYLNRFYYDCIVYTESALRFLIDSVGIDRVVFGTDWPYDMALDWPVSWVLAMESLSQEEKEKILWKNLEQLLGIPKSEWNAALVRALWPALESCMARRKGSADHEEAWLILAGFLLRPGFGAAADHVRIDSLWRLREQGLYFAGKRSKVQEYLLWRRVAGGLERQRQEQILAPELDKIRTQKKVAPELIRLAGSLERLPIQTKTELANLFIDASSSLARENKHCAPYLGALGHILSRAPLYAGPETVVSPDLVERAYEALRILDWAAPDLAEVQTLFLRAARVVGSRSFDLPQALRHRIAAKLEKAGVSLQRTGKLKEFTPVGGAERISLHDESLPPGLILTERVDNI